MKYTPVLPDAATDGDVRPMTGNEALARGAWEAGVKVAAAYPGTPSTEILEHLGSYPADDLHAQWSNQREGRARRCHRGQLPPGYAP